MKKIVELPLVEPVYSTYHNGAFTAIFKENPSLRNFYLNQVMQLTCTRKFLFGYTTPEINIVGSALADNPYIETHNFYVKFLKGYINPLIRNLIDNGYYVYFVGVDDYYIEGKSWYKEKHFIHDGEICGYNQEEKTYCIYAYDKNWIYQKFWSSQKSFNSGVKSALEQGYPTSICALKPRDIIVEFCPETVVKNIKEYLNSNFSEYSKFEEGPVFGIAVLDFISMYIDKLYDGSIPYDRMDRRVFRLIWEHKKIMLERIEKIESSLNIKPLCSEQYKDIVRESDRLRMLYAAHHMKRRDSVLPDIRDKLIYIKKQERGILKKFIEKAERRLKK